MLFASPWYLLGALGAAIPVLLHLFGRRRARRVPFPSLMLIRAAQRERTSLVRLRQVWLMLLRALAILLLSLALARPTVSWLKVTSNPDALTVFLLDDSLSMKSRTAGRSAFEVARRTATALLAALPKRQTVALAIASDPGAATYASAQSQQTALTALQPSYRAVDLPHALATSASLGTAAGQRRHVYLLTDLQATGWLSEADLKSEDRVTLVDCGQEQNNHALATLDLSEPPALLGRPVPLQATVRQYGRTTGPLTLRLRLGAGELPSQPVPLSAGLGRALFDWQPDRPGEVAAEATLPPDALREDDTCHRVVTVRERLRVSLVGAPQQTRWVRLALAPDAGAWMEVTAAPPSPQTDVALVWTSAQSAAWRRFAEGGGGLLVFAQNLSQATADTLLGPGALTLGAVRAANAPAHLATFDPFRAPLVAFANPASGDLQEPVFRTYRALSVPPQSSLQVLARFEDGTPALLRGSAGSGRLLLANFDPSDAGGDLVRQPVFVPLLHRLTGYLARGSWPELDEAVAGENLTLVPPSATSNPTCTGPEGRPLEVRVTGAGWALRPEEPGVYQLRWTASGAARSRSFAVNVDPRESDPARLSSAQLVQRLRPAQAEVVPATDALTTVRRSPLSLSTPLLALVLVLLLLELTLTRAGHEPRHDELLPPS